MAVTIAPSEEACQAIVDRINTGTTYPLIFSATYTENLTEDVEELDALRVDVVPLNEIQLQETLSVEDRTEHEIAVEVRRKIKTTAQAEVANVKLTARKIYQRVNNFNSADGRVQVWECDYESNENPNKKLLADHQIFRSRLLLKVRVSPSA